MRRLLFASGFSWLPVRARQGFIAGAWWSLYPWTSYWRGTHEPELQRVLAALGVRAGWCCWDLGAHFGFYSVGLARRVGPAGQVAAFEPNPLSFKRLAYHRLLNRLEQLRLFNLAASDSERSAELLTYGDLGSTTTHLLYPGELRTAHCEPVATRTACLDDLVAAGTLRPPQLIKIDVEGHGHPALAGMIRTVTVHRPILAVAFHCREEETEMLNLLQPLGYTVEPIGPPRPTGTPWQAYDALMRS